MRRFWQTLNASDKALVIGGAVVGALAVWLVAIAWYAFFCDSGKWVGLWWRQ